MSEYMAMMNSGRAEARRRSRRNALARFNRHNRRRFRIVNDDDPMDVNLADGQDVISLGDLRDLGDTETIHAVRNLRIGKSVTVGGGAAVQFTLTRIS